MIADVLYEEFKRLAAEKKSRPNPTGSKLGACTASLQMLVFPQVTNPEPWQPRGAAVVEFGSEIEEWLSKKIEASFPGRWGLRGQPFYFPIPIPPEAVKAGALDLILSRIRKDEGDRKTKHIFWGWPIDGFLPPRLTFDPERKKWRVRDIDPKRPYRPSVVLDRTPARSELPPNLAEWTGPVVWVAVYIDGLMPDPATGRMTLIEMKSMSNFAFRRALLGVLEYRYRVQLLTETMATHVDDAIWFLFRKETAHMAEVHFSRDSKSVLVRLRSATGWTEVLEVTDQKKGKVKPQAIDDALRRMVVADLTAKLGHEPTEPEIAIGLERDLVGDHAWDMAETWTPFDDRDLPSVYQRGLDVLTAKLGEWKREYGPNFVCEKCSGVGNKPCDACQGLGTRTCGYCKGTGQSARAKTPKPCSSCAPGAEKASGTVGVLRCGTCNEGGAAACLPAKPGRLRCDDCDNKGVLARAKLPAYPCGYCATKLKCWEAAGYEMVIENNRPIHYVNHDLYVKSGITFTPPESMEPASVETDEVPFDLPAP